MLPAILYIPLLGTSYFIFDLFHTEKAEVQDKTLQTTEFLNPELPDAQIKGGDGIGSKYENMAKSWGKIQDYSAVDNIERDEPDDNQEEYESQYTEEDIALLDRRQIELCRDTFPHIHTQDSVVRRALWQIARSCTILECDIQMPGRTFAEA